MIICQNVSSGPITFAWDGGASFVTAKASNWNGANVFMSFIDEFGDAHTVTAFSSDTLLNYTGFPAGDYQLTFSGSPVGVSISIRKVPV